MALGFRGEILVLEVLMVLVVPLMVPVPGSLRVLGMLVVAAAAALGVWVPLWAIRP